MKTDAVTSHKILVSCALTTMLVLVLLVLTPNQSLTVHEIEAGVLGFFMALLVECVWTKG